MQSQTEITNDIENVEKSDLTANAENLRQG